ncbi:hypothetical protein Mhar_0772 [Methanothrix harundinacea 6Ac]|uniref:Uncharacterized protein n=1 Tax=Methanothrix harundinacea (strain 6Ac) TaxID=1110509 RepID=G7WKW2_METH6|nr:hypothetical protein Mhar_0772 [Methanothrix harundinacea 6Ac]
MAGGVDHLQIPPAAEVDPVPVEELLVGPDGAGHQVLEAGDGAVGELLANVLDPSLIGRVARHRAARRLLYGPGRPHVVGVGVGQDEPRDLLGAPARTPQVYEIKNYRIYLRRFRPFLRRETNLPRPMRARALKSFLANPIGDHRPHIRLPRRKMFRFGPPAGGPCRGPIAL